MFVKLDFPIRLVNVAWEKKMNELRLWYIKFRNTGCKFLMEYMMLHIGASSAFSLYSINTQTPNYHLCGTDYHVIGVLFDKLG